MSRPGTARRALLALLLWAGFWGVALALVGVLGWIPVAQGLYAGGPGLAGILAGAGALTVLWALRPRGLFTREQGGPRPLSSERHPALFSLVEEVARRVGTRPPHEVHLSAEANASIHLKRRWLGLVRQPVVAVGFPLFALLTREELASVLAHEYGHHVGGDLALGPWVYRTRASIADAVEALDDSAFFLDMPFRAYGRLFLRVSSAVSRQQELAADALAARTCGATAAGSALRKVHELGGTWQAYLELELVPLVDKGARLPVLEGWRRFAAGGPRRTEVARALEAQAHRPPSPWDSHPPLEERLSALGAHGAASPAEAGCLELLGGEGAAEDAFYAHFTQGELAQVDWDGVAGEVLVPGFAQQLSGTALDPAEASLSALPALLAEGAALWDRVRPPGLDLLSAEAKRQRARGVLVQWLAAALVRHGFAATLTPGAELRLERAGQVVEPAALVERLASGALSSADYLAWCHEVAPAAA